jgi:spore germination cell wall hydrolase CwlJ-like protein
MHTDAITLQDLDALASMLAAAAAREPVEGLAALAWCLVNRIERAPSREAAVREFSQTLRRPAGDDVAAARDSQGTASRVRAMAYLGLALCGDLPDPTGGSTRFHRHDDWPAWARDREPQALVGSYFFYVEPGTGAFGTAP